MTREFVTNIAALFLNAPEDEINIVDYVFRNHELTFKCEDDEGFLIVYVIKMDELGYAKTQEENDFSVVSME